MGQLLWRCDSPCKQLGHGPSAAVVSDFQVLAEQSLLLQIVYAVRAKTTLAVDLKNVEENGAKTMAKAFQVHFFAFPVDPFAQFRSWDICHPLIFAVAQIPGPLLL